MSNQHQDSSDAKRRVEISLAQFKAPKWRDLKEMSHKALSQYAMRTTLEMLDAKKSVIEISTILKNFKIIFLHLKAEQFRSTIEEIADKAKGCMANRLLDTANVSIS